MFIIAQYEGTQHVSGIHRALINQAVLPLSGQRAPGFSHVDGWPHRRQAVLLSQVVVL
jgi:hypothetical protein